MAAHARVLAHPLIRGVLVLCCVLAMAPAASPANETPVPAEWPQVALIKNRDTNGAPDADSPGTFDKAGMPVPDARQAGYDVLHYGLELQVDPTWGWLAGKVTIIFRVTGQPLNEVVLDYRAGMHLSGIAITYPYRNNLSHSRVGDVLTLALPTPIAANDLGMIEVQFWGQPQPEGLFGYRVDVSDGGHPVVATVSEPWSARSWWPCKDDPNDKATVNTSISVPAGLRAVSNGVFRGRNGLVWSWSEELDIPTYLVSLAVSNYVSIDGQYDGPAGKIDLRHHVFPEDEAAAREDLSILPAMLDFCGSLFGPYPFVNQPFGIAEIAWDEAMEHPTAVTYGDVLITGTHQFDTVLMHEVAHMWFGNMISPKDWTHIWLNEGFATYVEALWAEHVYGPSGLRNFMASHDWGHGYGWDTLIRNRNNSNPPYYFRTIAYHKGAYVLHMLRRWVGDETFFAILAQYLADPQLRFRTADSADFQRVCEQVSGQDLDWFFNQWLYRTTYPMLRVDWQNSWHEGANEFRVRLRQEQDPEPDGSRPAYKIPVELRLTGVGLDSTVTILANKLDQEFMIPLGATVTKVVVDPDRWLLHDVVGTSGSKSFNVLQAPVRLNAAYPNPFNPRTVFHWEAAVPTQDLVEVFDVQGRRVLTEELGLREAGPREFLWRGVDDAGREHPSGTYLYRITCRGRTADGQEFSRELLGKVTLAR